MAEPITTAADHPTVPHTANTFSSDREPGARVGHSISHTSRSIEPNNRLLLMKCECREKKVSSTPRIQAAVSSLLTISCCRRPSHGNHVDLVLATIRAELSPTAHAHMRRRSELSAARHLEATTDAQ